jgi:hypothetical protein
MFSGFPLLPTDPFPGSAHLAKDAHVHPPVHGDRFCKFHHSEIVLRVRIDKSDGPDGRSDPLAGGTDDVVHVPLGKPGTGEVLLDEHFRKPVLGADTAYLFQESSHILRRVISRYDDVQVAYPTK